MRVDKCQTYHIYELYRLLAHTTILLAETNLVRSTVHHSTENINSIILRTLKVSEVLPEAIREIYL